MSNKNNLKFFENDRFVAIISVILAILLWFVVAFNNDDKITTTIKNVPVNFDITNGTIAKLNLYPVYETVPTVDIEVSGSRAVIGKLSLNDINVNANLKTITGPGSFDVQLDIENSFNKNFEIKSVKPEILNMRFDHKSDGEFAVELNTDVIEIPEGYILDSEYIYPSTINVSGPSTEIEQIDKCVINLSLDKPLKKTTNYELAPIFYDSEGNIINSPYFSLDVDKVSVTLPILKKKNVPITFDFSNIPSNFDISTLDYIIEPNSIEIAGPSESIDAITELHLGYIDLNDIGLDYNKFFNLNLPVGFITVDGTNIANVIFDLDNYSTTTRNVNNIKIVNIPDNLDINVSTKNIYDVNIIGPTKDIDNLDGSGIVAEIDISKVNAKVGQYAVNVSIIIPSNDTCWAEGNDYSAVITVKNKPD